MAKKQRMSAEEKDRRQRMKWWQEAKFGMFIHWGTYSVLGRHEWVKEQEGIPVEEYEALADRFKPEPNAPRAWAKLARQAGMKYMVMTTKHHEGFCLFDSKLTDYCAPKRACGRDLVKEYVAAARAEGLRVGFYYSLMDWRHPDGAKCATDEAARQRFVKYIHGQVRELCSNYGKVDVLWYDVPWPLDADGWESKKMNRMVRRLQPDVLINNRSKLPEDFSTPEQNIRAEPSGRGWEACMTMNGSWGYHKNDDAWKTPKEVVQNLVQCAMGGGNYLLNIGPKPDGGIPAPSVRILTAVGEWMKRYGHTIYGAERFNGQRSNWAQYTRKGKTLWVQCHAWPGEVMSISGLRTKVKSAKLLGSRGKVGIEQDRFRLRLTGLPAKAPDKLVSVVELECAAVPIRDRLAVRIGMARVKA